MGKIKIGIIGYGNLGKGVEYSLMQNTDMELSAIFTRRDPKTIIPITSGVKTYSMEDIESFKGKIDVMILCGGSATDLPVQGPKYAEMFNMVDSFDTHAKIPEYFDVCNKSSKSGNNISIISVGWDPGMFSLNRLYAGCVLPNGTDYTFWGKGVSQGHSDAIRRVSGVVDARQYTVPIQSAIDAVRTGSNPEFTTREKHLRVCYVVVEDSADKEKIANEIKTMPNYFADYDTEVNFISMEELKRDHSGIPHGGFVIRSGKTGENNSKNHIIEYSLKLDSNPEFTSSVLVCYARAAYRLSNRGESGCKTVFDIAPVDLSMHSPEELRKNLL